MSISLATRIDLDRLTATLSINNKYQKIEIPLFYGDLNAAEEFLNWQAEVDNYFRVMKVPIDKESKVVASRLKSVAAIWWDKVIIQRQRRREEPVRTWMRMKLLMRERFLPYDFQLSLYTNQCHREETISKPNEDLNATRKDTINEVEVQTKKLHPPEVVVETHMVAYEEENIFGVQQAEEDATKLLKVEEHVVEIQDQNSHVEDFVEEDATTLEVVQPKESVVATPTAMKQENYFVADIIEMSKVINDGVGFAESVIFSEPIDMVMPLGFALDGKLRKGVNTIIINLTVSERIFEDEILFYEENSGSSSLEVEDAGAFVAKLRDNSQYIPQAPD